ncbi:MAG: hypothetical protein AB7U76_25060 [Pirellulales bacterium]
MSFSFGSSKQKQQQQSQSDPWDVATPYITKYLEGLPTTGQGVTDAQKSAFDQLNGIASQGNPYAGNIDTLTKNLFNTTSYSPMSTDAYKTFQGNMGDVAAGKNQDLSGDKNLQDLIGLVGNNAANAVKSRFAAAGRDFSGYEGKNIAQGVTNAQLPVLVNRLNQEKARSDAAAGALYGAGQTTALNAQGLDANALGTQMQGITTGQAALDAQGWGPTEILALQEQMKNMPYDELAKIAALLYPAGNLGSQTEGSGTSSGTQFGLSGKLI